MQKKTLKNYLTAVLMAAGLVLLDQLTKRWAASALAEETRETSALADEAFVPEIYKIKRGRCKMKVLQRPQFLS